MAQHDCGTGSGKAGGRACWGPGHLRRRTCFLFHGSRLARICSVVTTDTTPAKFKGGRKLDSTAATTSKAQLGPSCCHRREQPA